MKIAYLAPELPALSATFVYNEIIQLEKIGTSVIPFSVHRPHRNISDPVVKCLEKRVTYLYERTKFSVLKSHIRLWTKFPGFYISTLTMLMRDMLKLSATPRTALGLVYRFFYSASLADDLNRHGCEHIHVHFAHIPTDIAMYSAKLLDITFSVTSHANDLFERGWLLPQKVSRSAFFGTISVFNRQFLFQAGADISQVRIVRCGVDLNQFSTRKNVPFSIPVRIGMVGRLVEKKGVDNLIESMAILKQQGIEVVLSIAGSGPLEAELIALAKEQGLGENDVEFLGSLPHSEVAKYIEGLSIFVLPCKQDANGDMDGIPVVLMEAMLTGVPVITTRISGIPELVVDEDTGLVVNPSDSHGLANAIVRMIEDETLRKRLIDNAVLKVKNEFSLAENVNKLNELFRAIHH